MILTMSKMDVNYDILTALSRLHSMGALYPSSDSIATESGYEPSETRLVLNDMEGMGWVSFSMRRAGWRLTDGVIALYTRIQYCDVCRNFEHQEVRAVADASTSEGKWGYFCSRHFLEFDCRLGTGLGQIIRFEY